MHYKKKLYLGFWGPIVCCAWLVIQPWMQYNMICLCSINISLTINDLLNYCSALVCMYACMWPLSVTRVWVQSRSVPWKLIEDGFSVCCILYPCILQLSICYVQQTLERNKIRERGIKRSWGVRIFKHRTKEKRAFYTYTYLQTVIFTL